MHLARLGSTRHEADGHHLPHITRCSMLHAVSISGHEDLRFAGKIDEAKKSEEDGRTTEDRRREKKDTA